MRAGLCMHTMRTGIDNKKALADGDGFQCSSSSASSDDNDNEPSNESLLKKLATQRTGDCRVKKQGPSTKPYRGVRRHAHLKILEFFSV